MSRDFETRLDDALTQLANGVSVDLADVPESANLIAVARELQILAPAPQPRLAEGRCRFLNAAARLVQPPRLFDRVLAYPARAFGFAAVLVLIVVGALLIAEMSFFASNVPAASSLTLTMSPTHLTTPTRTTAAPLNLVPSAPTLAAQLDSPQPKPVPTPMVARD
ncbi:MAG: hypothetical protein L0Y55_06755 [Anaerolineales bacterium]|nr:hypothetical protein [Anaerolineales bacterium]